jgi:AraC family transcriptional regulator of adaptative response/methylated-DNA-[protein]-cysteine methyltransferase
MPSPRRQNASMTTTKTAETLAFADEASRWQAVQTRDAAADGAFYSGVRSTGVYCRPSCPSRRPNRGQAVFFDTTEDARQAGFRACLRCRPDDVGADQLAVAQALRLIETSETLPRLNELAKEIGFSPAHLQRVFKRQTGLSPRQYAAELRQQRFRSDLRRSPTVTDAVYEAGFGSTRAAYERAGERLGMRPSAFRQGGRGERITYTFAESEIGPMLVAATERGICAVYLGTRDELAQQLTREFPAAELVEDEAAMGARVQDVVEAVASGAGSGLVLDAHGSEFQQQVWAALRQIPAGETRTYRQVAEAIGRPEAARAVARACATNPLALLTPCHRVVRADGGLGGYRWGVERKRALLQREGAVE